MATRSATFILSSGGHRRTQSYHGTAALPTAQAKTTKGHRRLSKRLSLDTRPTAPTYSQRPRISNGLPQRRVSDNGAPERTGRGARKGGTEDVGKSSGSSSDDTARPALETESNPTKDQIRPQSAWNSRSGRRPQFTFSDVDGDGDKLYDDLSTNGGEFSSDSRSTPVKPTTGRRSSMIPVRTDRLQPSIHHDADRPRRHSFTDIASQDAADTTSSDQQAEEETTSGLGCQMAPPSQARRRSFADELQMARSRAHARLAGNRESETEVTSLAVGKRPRKLDPITSPNIDRLNLDERSPEDKFVFDDDVTPFTRDRSYRM